MKKTNSILFSIALLFFLAPLKALAVADQRTADLYVQAAIDAKPEALNRAGPHRCSYVIGETFAASADTLQNAQTTAILKCIRSQCETLDQRISVSRNEILQMSPAARAAFMKARGFNDAEIAKVEQAASDPSLAIPKAACANTTPLGRMFVVDMCSATPMNCN